MEPNKGRGSWKNGLAHGYYELEGFDYLEGTEARGQWVKGKREGEFYIHYVNSRDGKDYIWDGIFKDDLLVEGTLNGDLPPWKNMSFVFLEGVGKGIYSGDDYEFQGCIKQIGWDSDAHHGKCEIWY